MALPRATLILAAVVVVANAIIMSVEMLATRLLFPQFGNTVFTWSGVISIIIAGLFLGYMGGGLAADRAKDRGALVVRELAASGVLVMFVPGLRDILLSPSAVPSVYPPLLPCFLVFGVPAALMAAVPPAVVGILVAEGMSPPIASGMVSALAAGGSIGGTLATTFYLIPQYGVRGLFVAFGVILGLLAAAVRATRRGRAAPAGKFLALALLYSAAVLAAKRGNANPVRTTVVDPVYSKDSHYQLIRVFEQGSGPGLMRLMKLDSTDEGAMMIATKDAVFEYTKAYRLFLNAFGREASPRILFIGGGAYTMPVKVAEGLPRAAVEVAEIDPEVKAVGEKYFRSAEFPNLTTILADGRQALFGRAAHYDAIFIDAYQGVMSVPFHLTTREFFTKVDESLKPGGFVSLNLIGDVGEERGFLCAATRTLRSVFPWVRLHPVAGWRTGVQNVIIVAARRQERVADSGLAGTGFETGLSPEQLPCRDAEILTDDHAPVEWLVSRYLKP